LLTLRVARTFHPSTVAIILRAARLGLFTTAEAGLLINRIRAHDHVAVIHPGQ
jgi:hypothetical protein